MPLAFRKNKKKRPLFGRAGASKQNEKPTLSFHYKRVIIYFSFFESVNVFL